MNNSFFPYTQPKLRKTPFALNQELLSAIVLGDVAVFVDVAEVRDTVNLVKVFRDQLFVDSMDEVAETILIWDFYDFHMANCWNNNFSSDFWPLFVYYPLLTENV